MNYQTHLEEAIAEPQIFAAAHFRRIADHLIRLDFVILDELGYLPSPRPAANCSST